MQKRSIELKNIILTESFQLFMKYGYENTTTREIAAACNIERGLLHYHYNQKQDILFEIYQKSLSFLMDYIYKYNEGEDAVVILSLCNIALYKLILSTDSFKSLFISILKNRDLAKVKIHKTMEVYQGVYIRKNIIISEKQLLLSSASSIGAESELILHMAENELDLTIEELAGWIIKLQLITLKFKDFQIDEVFSKALKLYSAFDEGGFLKNMDQELIWFNKEII